MVAHRLTPRRNSCSLAPSDTLKTLITVPFSDAVAIKVPVELKVMAARGESWAGIIVLAC